MLKQKFLEIGTTEISYSLQKCELMRNDTVPQIFQGAKRTHAILQTGFYQQQTENWLASITKMENDLVALTRRVDFQS